MGGVSVAMVTGIGGVVSCFRMLVMERVSSDMSMGVASLIAVSVGVASLTTVLLGVVSAGKSTVTISVGSAESVGVASVVGVVLGRSPCFTMVPTSI